MEIIFSLIVSVCTEDLCLTQPLQDFRKLDDCYIAKQLHDEIPKDGDWINVEYICKMENGKVA